MKKRLIGLLLCIAMIFSAMPMLALADDGVAELPLDDILAEKKFEDVTDGSWYADGVYYCVEAGFMSGTSESRFTPHGSMTRAMFVTMLAAYDGADLSGYTESSFTDVAPGKWYAPAVEWAYENGIVGGIGEGVFGYKNTVTRQEIALMLMTYLGYKGVDTTPAESFIFGRYADKDDISSWAETAVEWACGLGLFSAAGNEGDLPLLKPKNTATRAQVALIMKNFDETLNPVEAKLTIA
ncbi:MAG: S-layer homology domain-containing protein, partial [Clostridia bacterium]|nr:S-layer homology domain-containing protein [Clostridia bacterium]